MGIISREILVDILMDISATCTREESDSVIGRLLNRVAQKIKEGSEANVMGWIEDGEDEEKAVLKMEPLPEELGSASTDGWERDENGNFILSPAPQSVQK